MLTDLLILRMLRRRRQRREQSRQIEINQIQTDSLIDPLDLPDSEFIENFHLTKPICRILLGLILPHMRGGIRSTKLTGQHRVLCALKYFTGGCYQKATGKNEKILSMSQASVSRCIREVCQVINEHLALQFINFPTTQEQKDKVKDEFHQKYMFPGVIGSMHGEHFKIKKPSGDIERKYYSAKHKFHTKNVLIICDSNLRILYVNTKFGGAERDDVVFNKSHLSAFLKDSHVSGEESDTWLIGGKKYNQLPYLMTPLPNPKEEYEKAYNESHKQCLSCSQRCTGVLRSRFRCLSRKSVLTYTPDVAGDIISACCVLHNILMKEGYKLPNELLISEEMEDFDEIEEFQDAEHLLEQGQHKRQDLIRKTFL